MNFKGTRLWTNHFDDIAILIFQLLCLITSALPQVVFNPETDGCSELSFKCSPHEYNSCINLENVCDGESYYYRNNGGCISTGLESTDEQICKQKFIFKTGNGSDINYDLYTSTLRDQPERPIEEFLSVYDHKEAVSRFRNFDPEEIMNELTKRAASMDILPITFTEEMRIILSSHSTDAKDYSPGYYPYVDFLIRKYNISAETQDPSAATLFRLHLMFPHYTKIGLRSTFHSENIQLPGVIKVPAMIGYAEFGGLIPRTDNGLSHPSVRKTLIGSYLAFMNRQKGKKIPFHVHCIMLRERMDKSMLSDERRIQLLQNYVILTKANGLVEQSFECLRDPLFDTADCIPRKFAEGCSEFLE